MATDKIQRRTVDVPEFAAILGVSPSTAWRLVWDGRVKVIRVARRRAVIPMEEVERFLRENLEGGDPNGGRKRDKRSDEITS